MQNERPIVSLGHVCVKTDRLKACVEFYAALGMTRTKTDEPKGVALMQMRGGTDLVLVEPSHPFAAEVEDSRVSYGDFVGPVDLLIASRERDDLTTYREGLVKAGLKPSDIQHETTGHHTFHVVDPDGRKVTIFTNYANYEIKN